MGSRVRGDGEELDDGLRLANDTPDFEFGSKKEKRGREGCFYSVGRFGL